MIFSFFESFTSATIGMNLSLWLQLSYVNLLPYGTALWAGQKSTVMVKKAEQFHWAISSHIYWNESFTSTTAGISVFSC